MRCAAVDIGASGGRVFAGSLSDDRIRLEEIHRFHNEPLRRDGHLRWDVETLFDQLRLGLSRLPGSTGWVPESVGVDTWGVDYALIDPAGCLIELPVCYRDDRTEGAMEDLLGRLDASLVYERTGIQFLRINTLYQLYALSRESPELLRRADCLLMMPDYFHYRLAGERSCELTDASTTQMIGLLTSDWDRDLLEAIPVDRSLLITPLPPGSDLGPVAAGAGLPGSFRSTRVIAPATHDTASAVAAAPALDDGWAFISSGTWCLMGIESRVPIVTEDARRLGFTNESGVEGSFRFLRNLPGLWLIQRLRESIPGRPSYDELESMAERAGPFGCVIDPADPVFFSPACMMDAMQDYCRRTGQQPPEGPGACVRTALEGLAMSFARTLGHLRRLHSRPINRIHMLGGGCRSPLLCRMASAATGLPVVCGPVEATAAGNVLVQGIATGAIPDLASARRLVYSSFDVSVYEPEDTETWTEQMEIFEQRCEVEQ